MLLLLLPLACTPDKIQLDDAADLADACAELEQQPLESVVEFPTWRDGCAWGEDGNLDPAEGVFTARREEEASVEVPASTAVCDLGLDFASPDGGTSTPMVYDDNFVLTFDGVVLATSYAPLIDMLPVVGGYPVWDWEAVAGQPLSFDAGIPTWCLGEDEGLADCTIPAPETMGNLSLAFDDAIVGDLGFLAFDQGVYTFAFITLGDNDTTDCAHEDFAFTVTLPYVEI